MKWSFLIYEQVCRIYCFHDNGNDLVRLDSLQCYSFDSATSWLGNAKRMWCCFRPSAQAVGFARKSTGCKYLFYYSSPFRLPCATPTHSCIPTQHSSHGITIPLSVTKYSMYTGSAVMWWAIKIPYKMWNLTCISNARLGRDRRLPIHSSGLPLLERTKRRAQGSHCPWQ